MKSGRHSVPHDRTANHTVKIGGSKDLNTEECLICKAPLEYLTQDETMECAVCHKQEASKTHCVNGHYVCSDCHVAFLCVHNSCRSQIAEALGRKLAGDVFDSFSAGTEPGSRINPDAVRLMKQVYCRLPSWETL